MRPQTIQCPHCRLTIVIEAGEDDDDDDEELEAEDEMGDEEL